MSKRDDGGPAFPRAGYCPSFGQIDRGDMHYAMAAHTEPQDGLSLRDYFAAAALTGMCSPSDGTDLADEDLLARSAYRIADAMLARRREP